MAPARHFKHDPFRFPAGRRDFGPRFNPFVRQLERVPRVSQLASVDVIQRASSDKLVTFYLRAGSVDLFPDDRPELRLARVILETSGDEVPCDVVLHRGRLSSLEFRRPPKGLVGRKVSCRRVDLLAAPMGSPRESMRTASHQPLLWSIAARVPVTHLQPPPGEDERDRAASAIGEGLLPVDYVALLNETNGFTAGKWRFPGTAIRTIVLADATYYVLAERLDSQVAICIEKGDPKSRMILYDEIDDERIPAEQDFIGLFVSVATGDEP